MISSSSSKASPDARQDFVFIGEHPAIDFVNTVVAEEGRLKDLLSSWSDVLAWLAQSGLSHDPSLQLPPSRLEVALKKVLQLRQSWKEVLTEITERGKVNDGFLEELNPLLAEVSFHETLHRTGKKGFHLDREVRPLEGEKLALALLARQIALFLAEANLKHLHRCANTTSCVLLFYDKTKNHRRQWCSAAACGNRHKVAAFRKRHARKQTEAR